MSTSDPRIKVTPWSKTPVRTYEEVGIELVSVLDVQLTLLLLNKPNGFSMALELNPAAMERLIKDFQRILTQLKAHKDKPNAAV